MDAVITKPRISIIAPVYKVEPYLSRCVDSILRQSFTDFELILVDDGSPDNCGRICDEYAEKDSRIKVIHQKNAGSAQARNVGMDIAVGEWIAFVDPDDWVHKDYLKILMSGVMDDTDIVLCDCLTTSKESEDECVYTNAVFKDALLDEISKNRTARTRVWGRIYRRKTIGDLRFITEAEIAEDACFNELLNTPDTKFRITDAKLYYYFMRSDSAIHILTSRKLLGPVNPLIDRLQKIEDKEKQKRIILRCYKYILSARYGEMFADDYPKVKKQCRVLLKKLSAYITELNPKEQVIMRVFSASPLLYRMWRIYDDPTLLKYEKNQKELKKNKNRQ